MASGTQWEREEVSPKEASVEMRLELGVDGWRDLEPVQEGEFNPTNSGESLKLWGLPGGASGKEPACQCRRHKRCRFDPWVGKIPWRRGNPLQYSCLENPMDRGARWATVPIEGGCTESDTTEVT